MTTAAVIDELAGVILTIRRPRPVRILIDGRSCAGKTTFSGALAERLGKTRVVHFDDFHPAGYRAVGSAAYTPERYLDEGYDFAVFQQQVLEPTREGADGVIALRLPGLDDGSEAKAPLGPGAILVVEGAFLLKPALRAWWDFAIWLDIDFPTMVRRAVGRDVAWVGDAERVRHRYETFWTAAHALYEAGGPQDAANAVIDNEDPARARIIRLTPPLP